MGDDGVFSEYNHKGTEAQRKEMISLMMENSPLVSPMPLWFLLFSK
jgi:hypothetical protein